MKNPRFKFEVIRNACNATKNKYGAFEANINDKDAGLYLGIKSNSFRRHRIHYQISAYDRSKILKPLTEEDFFEAAEVEIINGFKIAGVDTKIIADRLNLSAQDVWEYLLKHGIVNFIHKKNFVSEDS